MFACKEGEKKRRRGRGTAIKLKGGLKLPIMRHKETQQSEGG